jgi:hypothetical protein
MRTRTRSPVLDEAAFLFVLLVKFFTNLFRKNLSSKGKRSAKRQEKPQVCLVQGDGVLFVERSSELIVWGLLKPSGERHSESEAE